MTMHRVPRFSRGQAVRIVYTTSLSDAEENILLEAAKFQKLTLYSPGQLLRHYALQRAEQVMELARLEHLRASVPEPGK